MKPTKIMTILSLIFALFISVSCGEKKAAEMKPSVPESSGGKIKVFSAEKNDYSWVEKIQKSDAEWEKQLSPISYDVTRKQGTERSFTGKYWDNHAKGIYSCICCGTD